MVAEIGHQMEPNMTAPCDSPSGEPAHDEFYPWWECYSPDNDMMTSFSNPNYTLSDPDALNSNLPPSTEFFDNDNLYEDPDLMDTSTSKTNSSSKRRKKYSAMDLGSMGIDLTDGSLMVHNDLQSPDSVASSDSEHNSGGSSSATSPVEKTTSIVEVEHTANNTDDESDTYAQIKPTGFLGYYASLELSAKARQEERESKESEEEEEDEEEAEKTPLVAKPQPSVSKQSTAYNKSYDDKTKDINSPDSNDSGIQADVQHVRGPVNNDLYAVIDRSKARAASPRQKEQQAGCPTGADDQTDPSDDQEEVEPPLPAGWQKHEDEDGAYYWHIKSGTIQRDPPPRPPAKPRREGAQRSTSSGSEVSQSSSSDSDGGPARGVAVAAAAAAAVDMTTDTTSTPPQAEPAIRPGVSARRSPTRSRPTQEDPALQTRREKPASPSADSDPEVDERRIRFAVRSLGWVRIAEDDLTPERSSKAVNKCIVDLSLGRNDINDVVGRWGDGKDLFMDLDSEHLTLTDPQDMSILNIQPIQSIRVWGVGRDNGRDFAYVARDRMTRKHMCHVFRCDTPARQIANTLRDICKQIMVERSLQQQQQQQQHLSDTQGGLHKMAISRPNNLPDLNKAGSDHNGQKLTFQNLYKNTSFPTPMEEPKKVLRCHYLGAMHVNSASGIQTLNAACSKAYSRVPPEKWVFVSVGVAPSTITITEHGSDNILAECRVRFLSFMGIAMRNVKMCAFIMHTAQDTFLCHIFHCEPSAGALCKTIEAACKLRYQKCLDAHPQTPGESKKNTQPPQKQGLGASIKSVFGSIKGRKTKDKEKS